MASAIRYYGIDREGQPVRVLESGKTQVLTPQGAWSDFQLDVTHDVTPRKPERVRAATQAWLADGASLPDDLA